MIIVCGKSNGHVYKVGDSIGWTNVGHFDYKTWAATKTFHVGDIIGTLMKNFFFVVFEYNKQFHNVVRVTHKNFNSCNSTGAYATFTSGNDSFIIRRPGHFYFISNFTGHCESGQKVDIRVPGPHTPSPSPIPIRVPPPPTWLTPPSPAIESPAPAPAAATNGGSSFYSSKDPMNTSFLLSTLVLALLLFGIDS
ncbi:hypothetical protein ACH5RR_010664 [Cinchona calisaya]|uniref:Phytocyanin domain-containing protein n=1 Tax=Cinchona calisaya TaxID=153742 RepID=A0ABD3AJJ9_9GENT